MCEKKKAEKHINRIYKEFKLDESDELCYADFITYWVRKNLVF